MADGGRGRSALFLAFYADFDKEIMREMGSLGILGATIQGTARLSAMLPFCGSGLLVFFLLCHHTPFSTPHIFPSCLLHSSLSLSTHFISLSVVMFRVWVQWCLVCGLRVDCPGSGEVGVCLWACGNNFNLSTHAYHACTHTHTCPHMCTHICTHTYAHTHTYMYTHFILSGLTVAIGQL